ncbi:MAG TPA: hypothetical protein DEA26_00120 [Oceanospirillales bacterium]|nr:hypothetical protein [Oceanospirillaceae bacterium]HBS41051.1 hypothetical protein [Oceanospirillales bacterium]
MHLMNTTPLTGLLLAALLAPASAWAEKQSINVTRTVSADESVEIEVMRGDVIIVGVKNKVFHVEGQLDEKAEGFELESSGGHTVFRVKMPRRVSSGWGSSDEGSQLSIEVPEGAHVEFEGVNANVRVTGIEGGTEITTVNGGIEARKLAGPVSLETVNGRIDSRSNKGYLTLSTVNGRIIDESDADSLEMESVNGSVSSRSTSREIEVSTVNGRAQLTLDGTERLEFSTVNGEIEVLLSGSKSPYIEGSSVSGSIGLTLPDITNARVSIEASAGGSIDNGLTDDPVMKAKYGPMRNLEFIMGDGKGRIDLQTVSGDLSVKR